MSGSDALASDVTQDVFMLLIERDVNYDPQRGTLGAYLYGIARNQLLRVARERRFLLPLAEEADDDAALAQVSVDETADVTRIAITAQTSERVWRAVMALPINYREAVILNDSSMATPFDTRFRRRCFVIATVVCAASNYGTSRRRRRMQKNNRYWCSLTIR